MNIQRVINRIEFYHVITFAIILIGIVSFIKFNTFGTIIKGSDTYYDLTIAEQIQKHGVPLTLNLAKSSQPYILNAYHLILSGITNTIPILTFMSILGPLSALCMVLLSYRLFIIFGMHRRNATIATLLVTLSPVLIYMILSPGVHTISSLIVILTIVTFAYRWWISIPLYLALPFFGAYHALFGLLLLIMYHYNRPANKSSYITAAVLISTTLLIYTPVFLTHEIIELSSASEPNSLQALFTDLGSPLGFSIFAVVLAVIGFSNSWRYKKKLWRIMLIIPAALMLVFVKHYLIIYLNLAIAASAGIAIWSLAKRNWMLKQIKDISMFLITLGLIFSLMSYTNETLLGEPTGEMRESLEWMKENTKSNGVILSHPKYSTYIQFFAKRPVVIDTYSDPQQDAELLNMTDKLFNTRSIVTAKELLRSLNISHIWIHPDMKDSLVWNREDEGLLFLFQNNETFKKVYEKDSIEIWETGYPIIK